MIISSQAYAGVVTSCGGSRGYAYFFPGGLVPSDQEGWQSDKISKGGIIFTMDGEKADIIIRDALDRTTSVKEDGGIAIAARMLVIAITISCSMSVKPDALL